MESVSEVRPDQDLSDEVDVGTTMALPLSVEDLIANKKSKKTRTLNDQIESIYLELWIKPEFKRVLDAVWKEHAVEGDLFVDDIMACEMIREQARKSGNRYISNQPLAAVRRALLVVMRRYGMSRKERRDPEYAERAQAYRDTIDQ